MDTLDTPVQLKYNNGNLFPTNMVMTAFTFIPFSIFLVFYGTPIFGILLFIIALPVALNRNYLQIEPEENTIHEYTIYLGCIKVGKKFRLSDYKYITAMPFLESKKVHASTSNSTTISDSFTVITLFKDYLRGKKMILKLKSKGEADNLGKILAGRLDLKFFEYDPVLVRQVLLGQKTL